VTIEDERRRRLRHDLRTPLTIVSGFAEVLAGDRTISDADRREYASRIHAAAIEIGELVDQLLEDGVRPLGAPEGSDP
jgi:two-component system phosphate regulon sensor histidine kinase PhoR